MIGFLTIVGALNIVVGIFVVVDGRLGIVAASSFVGWGFLILGLALIAHEVRALHEFMAGEAARASKRHVERNSDGG